MSGTGTRALRLLSLLQMHRQWSGGDLAARLQVSERTLRRDVDRLRSLGYPVESTRGVEGGYQLGAGATLPPLVLDDSEAVALAVSLHRAAQSGSAAIAEAAVSALAKVVAMLPVALRRQIDTLRAVTVAPTWTSVDALSPEVLGVASYACRDQVRLRFHYVAASEVATDRYVEPYRLVALGSRWYLVAFDLDRDDWRTFRLDRVSQPTALRNTFSPRSLPAEDLADYVRQGIEQSRSSHHVVFTVNAQPDDARQIIGTWATAEATNDPLQTRVSMDVESLDWVMLVLTRFDTEFTIISPPELANFLHDRAERLLRCTHGESASAS